MKSYSEYDQRQLKLMYESLKSFDLQKLSLNSLIGNLEFLLNAMEEVDEEWENAFLEEVASLESINANELIRSSGENVPIIEDQKKSKLISESISNLESLICKKLTMTT